jgi:hypothetical protein
MARWILHSHGGDIFSIESGNGEEQIWIPQSNGGLKLGFFNTSLSEEEYIWIQEHNISFSFYVLSLNKITRTIDANSRYANTLHNIPKAKAIEFLLRFSGN